MLKKTPFFLLLFVSYYSFSQNFEQVFPGAPALQMNADILFSGEAHLFDFDNDGDMDALIKNRIYLNEGNEIFKNYIETDVSMENNGFVTSFDSDNDGDLDLIVAEGGAGFESHPIRLLLNDGSGNFSEYENAPFDGGYFNYIETGDVNNDGNTDVIIASGYFFDGSITTKLYLNNGNNSYTIQDTNLEDLNRGYIKLVDVDNDNDLDVIAKGQPNGGGSITKTYKNDGSGIFTEYTSGLNNLQDSQIGMSDIDNDNDLDVVIIGRQGSSTIVSEVYKNDGTGIFTLVQNLSGVSSPSPDGWAATELAGSVSFGDIDNDGDDDLIIAGSVSAASNWDSHLYINDGTGLFAENTQEILDLDQYAFAKFVDIDNDGLLDIFQTVRSFYAHRLFMNQGSLEFKLASGSFLDGNIFQSNALLIDIENDGDLDLFVYGKQNFHTDPTNYNGLFINNGNGIFTETVSNLAFNNDALWIKFADFADVDNDGDLDLFANDYDTPQLFINTGNGNFVENTNFGVTNNMNPIAKFIDFNNDGLPDLFAGSTLYQNLGGNQFSEVFTLNSSMENIVIGDYNNDGFLDFITGVGSTTTVFYGDGQGNFVVSDDGTFTADYSWTGTQNLFVVDINNDNFLDFVFSYGIFLNDGSNHLYEDTSNTSALNFNSIIHVADLDGDNDLDVITKMSTEYTNVIHLNDGTGILDGGQYFGYGLLGDLIVSGDFDNDTDTDLFVFSHNPIGGFKEYKNTLFENTTDIIHEFSFTRNMLAVFPNPAAEFIVIDFNSRITNVDIFNEEGVLVCQSNILKVDVSKLPIGTYLVRVTGNDGKWGTSLFLKQ